MPLLKLLLIAAFFNALSWIVLIPVWQYPDEQAHFAQVQDLAELGKVPTGAPDTSYEIALSEEILATARDEFGNNKFTYHPEYKLDYSPTLYGPYEKEVSSLPKSARSQLVKNEATLNPPLYYFLASIFYRIFYDADLFTRVIAVRIMSALIFLGTILVAFSIGKLIFDQNKILPPALAALVAFKPMLVFASTGVLPDTLTNFLFSLILFFSLKIIKEGFKFSTLALIVLTIVLGVSTRQQFLISVPIVLAAVLYQVFRHLSYFKWALVSTAVFSIFLYFANTTLISKPFFTNFRVPEVFDAAFLKFGPLSVTSFIKHFTWTIRHTYAEVWPWYWGVYRWLSFTLPPIYYQVINRLGLIALVGLIIKIFFIIKYRKFDRKDVYMFFLITASLIYFFTLTVWDYLFWLKSGFSFGIQGRYFFPTIIPFLTLIIAGFWQIFRLLLKKYASIGIYALILFFIFFNNFSLFYVASSYYDISNLSTFIKQVSQYKPLIIKGNAISMILFLSLTFQSIFIFSLGKYIIKRNVST